MKKRIAIIGAGPAGLMAAEVLSQWDYDVHVYEQKPSAIFHMLNHLSNLFSVMIGPIGWQTGSAVGMRHGFKIGCGAWVLNLMWDRQGVFSPSR